MHTKILAQIKEEALKASPYECCGFIVIDGTEVKIIPCENVAENPLENFEIKDVDYLSTLKRYDIVGIYHSHPSPDHSNSFSELDINTCNLCNIPFYLYNIESDSFHSIYPKNYKPVYLGKPFIWGVYDCLSVVRSYYKHHFNIEITDYHRDETFYSNPDNRILENFEKEGFIEIKDFSLMRKHDVLVFYGVKNMPQHFGIYQEKGQMVHHLLNRVSCKEGIGAFGRKKTLVLRHRSLN